MRRIRIFIASPREMVKERNIVSLIGEELRRTIGDLYKTEIETVRWETHAWPAIGNSSQDVINREIGEYDVLIGIMWKRFGHPTGRASSGTEEEFQRAHDYFKKYGRPKIMFYFKTTPFYTTNIDEINQFLKVIQFRKKMEELGILFWEYNGILQFERSVREHLIKQISQLINKLSLENK